MTGIRESSGKDMGRRSGRGNGCIARELQSGPRRTQGNHVCRDRRCPRGHVQKKRRRLQKLHERIHLFGTSSSRHSLSKGTAPAWSNNTGHGEPDRAVRLRNLPISHRFGPRGTGVDWKPGVQLTLEPDRVTQHHCTFRPDRGRPPAGTPDNWNPLH